MLVNTSDLTGPALNHAVFIAKGFTFDGKIWSDSKGHYHKHDDSPSTDWSQGGPLLDQEHIGIDWRGFGLWEAWDDKTMPAPRYTGPTALIALCRCFVASKLGDTVEIPDELVVTQPVVTLNRDAVWPFSSSGPVWPFR